MHLMAEEQRRADDAERQLELQRQLNTAMVSVMKSEKIPSVAPGLTVHGKGWKFVIPVSLIAAISPFVGAFTNDYLELRRQVKVLTEYVSKYEQRFEKVDKEIRDVNADKAVLRETLARQSGYIAGVLPKAGVSVPGSEPGAVVVDVISDPLPPGTKPRAKVNVRTLVPAPPPKKQPSL